MSKVTKKTITRTEEVIEISKQDLIEEIGCVVATITSEEIEEDVSVKQVLLETIFGAELTARLVENLFGEDDENEESEEDD